MTEVQQKVNLPVENCSWKAAGRTNLVSVVVVSWNACSYLEGCLRSLYETQGSIGMEVIVVDNASSDGSVQMIAREFPQVVLVQNTENLGFARANNIGISHASGRYIALVNSDVKVSPGCIEALSKYLDENQDAGMVGPYVQGGDGHLQRSCRGFPSPWKMLCRAVALDVAFPQSRTFGGYMMPYFRYEQIDDVDILSGCFWMVRKSALASVGLLDEAFFMYGEDMDWCLRFKRAGWRNVFVPRARIIHYGGASSGNAPTRFYIEKQRADLQYWKKHHGWFGELYYFCVSLGNQSARLFGHGFAGLLGAEDRDSHWAKAKRSYHCLLWLLTRGKIS